MSKNEFERRAAIAIAASLAGVMVQPCPEQIANGHGDPWPLYSAEAAAREAKDRARALTDVMYATSGGES